MSTAFGLMHSCADGVNRVNVSVTFEVSRGDIVKMVAASTLYDSRLTKHDVFKVVRETLHEVGNPRDYLFDSAYVALEWADRMEWAEAEVARLFSGWAGF